MQSDKILKMNSNVSKAVSDEVNELTNFLPEENQNYDDINKLMSIIVSCRADNYKEAMNILHNDKILDQQLEAQQNAAESARRAAEAQQQAAKYAEQQARATEQSARDQARQKSRDAIEKEKLAAEAHTRGLRQCNSCAKRSRCGIGVSRNNTGNCAAYEPR